MYNGRVFLLLRVGVTKDIVSRDPKSGRKFEFSGGLIWIVLHYPKREQSLFIFGDGSQQKQTFKNARQQI